MPPRTKTCRYRRLDENPCSNPAVDQAEGAPAYLCIRHLARAMELIQQGKTRRNARQ